MMRKHLMFMSIEIIYNLKVSLKKSIFETNPILLDKSNIKLIEYTSLYGSNEIIKYMLVNECKLTSNIWEYAIHCQSEELIKYLEDNHVLPPHYDYLRDNNSGVNSIFILKKEKCHQSKNAHHSFFVETTYITILYTF